MRGGGECEVHVKYERPYDLGDTEFTAERSGTPSEMDVANVGRRRPNLDRGRDETCRDAAKGSKAPPIGEVIGRSVLAPAPSRARWNRAIMRCILFL
jgi:hypothetical protein